MNSKDKGDLSEAKALCEFQKYGIPVSLPWGDNQRYDMIADFDGKLNRIQVKTANEERDGALVCCCVSSQNHTTNKKYYTYINDVDYFVFYNQTYDKIALVPMTEIGSQLAMRLRIRPTHNNQKIGIRYFDDYSFDKKFNHC